MTLIRPLKEHEATQVSDLWSQMCTQAGSPLPNASLQLIRANLRKYTAHPQVQCFVAQDLQLIGFVTCSVTGHPVMPGLAGEIEELYVQPHPQRDTIRAELVQQAVHFMQNKGVGSICTRICIGKECSDEKDLRTFWETLGWENDMTMFSIYSNVPGDPALQHIWDSYQAQAD